MTDDADVSEQPPAEEARAHVLVVEDDDSLRKIAAYRLEEAGYAVFAVSDGEAGLQAFESEAPDLVLTDLRMPGLSGEALADEVLRRDPEVPVVVMTGHGTVRGAVEAMRRGVADYVLKPVSWDEMLVVVQRELERRALRSENRRLRGALRARHRFAEMVGESDAMQAVFEAMDRLRDTDTTVLIEGESGTGKELVARALHHEGARSDGPFVPVNCGAIPEDLVESELFGHEAGAFTGAERRHRGYFEQASGGTLFLDEIGELPRPVQVTLLRVLTERAVRRVGGEARVPVDVRVVAATNRSLEVAVEEGDFRSDLYYRLAVVPLRIPPLRERGDDALLLAHHLAEKHHGRPVEITSAAADAILRHAWPGNVRELENVVQRALVLGDGVRIDAADLPPDVLAVPAAARPDEPFPEEGVDLAAIERDWIRRALTATGGNRTHAARLLGITRQTLLYRMEKHGIRVPPPGSDESA